ncbi:MAG: magnesium/cobalt transporter CorA [Jiangellaceae bacterium]|nr:magnesium/cobalt transporter CorA [Jiangellaceae bacterium]
MTVVDWALYRDGMRESATSPREAIDSARRNGGFVWIGLHQPDESQLNKIAQEFSLHPLAVEDAVHAHQRPKLERYGDTLFVVFKTVRYVPHTEVTESSEIVETGELMLFVGDCFVVTVRHGEHGALKPVRDRLENDPDMLHRGSSAVLYAVADQIVDTYLDVADRIQDDITELEEEAFSDPGGRDAARVYHVKRELLEFRRAVNPLAQPMRMLTGTQLPAVDPKVRHYFRDVEDHLTRVQETVAAYDELLTSMLQANLAQLSVAQNADMRKITSWAAIIAVPTAIAGIYGMNFTHMPELTWRFGYPLVMAVIGLVCLLLYRGFKRNGWL